MNDFENPINFFPGWILRDKSSFFSLSEDIRAGVEQRKNEVHSEEDMNHLIEELKLKK